MIILESTGARYVFDRSRSEEVPMPFLHSLVNKSLVLKNHYSVANTSPRSVFSIFSGIYPMPEVDFFVMRKDIHIPSLISFLPESYDRFVANPSFLEWFFPRFFFVNSGLKEIYHFSNLPLKKLRPSSDWARNELDVADTVLKRMSKSRKKNFANTYITYAPHWPYYDHGPEFELLPKGVIPQWKWPVPRRPFWINRYYNALRVQDTQVEKVIKYLQNRGQLKDTIVVIVGDHGEAFGQHTKNWIHSKGSYNENYQTPALVYQPELFKPRVMKEITSHIDILPTLLDAMNIPYNRNLLQGESLFQDKFKRKYIFLYGNEDTLSSISRKKIKLQFLFKEGRCRAFDLNADPMEKETLPCAKYPQQKSALQKYYGYQKKILRDYNQSLLKKEPFYGQSHTSNRVVSE